MAKYGMYFWIKDRYNVRHKLCFAGLTSVKHCKKFLQRFYPYAYKPSLHIFKMKKSIR